MSRNASGTSSAQSQSPRVVDFLADHDERLTALHAVQTRADQISSLIDLLNENPDDKLSNAVLEGAMALLNSDFAKVQLLHRLSVAEQ